MRQIIFILFLLLTIQGYSQTKAETINWIVKKIKDYGNINEQTIIYADYNGNITYSSFSAITHVKYISSFSLNDIISANPLAWLPGEKMAGFKVSIQTKKNKVKDISTEHTKYGNSVVLILDYDEEIDKDLSHRFYKAMAKLIAYNKAELQNEPF